MAAKADEIYYVSEEYDENCMRLRNQYMVDRSAYCLCALWRRRSGTAQTVAMAQRKGIKIINLAEGIKV